MEQLGRILVLAGLALIVVGALVWWSGPRLGTGGPLPGDLTVRRGNVTFFFPIVTCLVLSVVLTVLFRLFNR